MNVEPMRPSSWVSDNIERLTSHYRLVWVEDPYELLEQPDATALRQRLQASGNRLVLARNAFRLREQLVEQDPDTARLVVIDQSYTLRESHLAPRDARPADLRSLAAPDWKPRVDKGALFRPTVQGFLQELTGETAWPVEVNIFPYEKLAREHTADFVEAWESFRKTGSAVTTDDLVVVAASAVLGLDLFSLSDPIAALDLALHEERWQALGQFFNTSELNKIRSKLGELPQPLGDLFGERRDSARAATVALMVLKQHFEDGAGSHLSFMAPALVPYASTDVAPLRGAVPPWFLETEIPYFEKLLTSDFLRHLHAALRLEELESRRRFAKNERLSRRLLAEFVSFEGGFEAGTTAVEPARQRDEFDVGRLVPDFMRLKRELRTILEKTRSGIEGLRLIPVRTQSLGPMLNLFVEQGFYRAELLSGRVENLIRDIEGPARRAWPKLKDFEARWREEVRDAREAVTLARKLADDLDVAFGRLLEERYGEVTPKEIPTTDLFYERLIAPRRRLADGSLKKSVVLVFDSMRLDLWRDLVRPVLERDYSIEEWSGFARLPSETRVSRRAFFAGNTPGKLPPSGRESDLFAVLLSRIHGIPFAFQEVERRAGMAFAIETADRATYAAVFDFPDVLSHEVNWDIHTLQDAQRHLIRQVQAVLREAGPDALVFITTDHGHVFQGRGAPVPVFGEDVGYRSAYVRDRIQGQHAAHVFQLGARSLGHEREGWFVFPKPGFALRDPKRDTRPFRPSGTYRHGGLSLFEVLIPVAYLQHREARIALRLTVSQRGALVAGQRGSLQVSASADGVLSTPVTLTADHPGIEPSVVSGLSTTPATVTLGFTPSVPGRQPLRVSAVLGAEELGEALVEIEVQPAPVPEDKALEKLRKLFGED